jgi:hypothetical protein
MPSAFALLPPDCPRDIHSCQLLTENIYVYAVVSETTKLGLALPAGATLTLQVGFYANGTVNASESYNSTVEVADFIGGTVDGSTVQHKAFTGADLPVADDFKLNVDPSAPAKITIPLNASLNGVSKPLSVDAHLPQSKWLPPAAWPLGVLAVALLAAVLAGRRRRG